MPIDPSHTSAVESMSLAKDHGFVRIDGRPRRQVVDQQGEFVTRTEVAARELAITNG